MLKEYLKDNIKIINSIDSWENAIQVSAQPLLKNNLITKDYVDAMINSVHKNGSYIIVMPQIALAHARPEDGVIGNGISILKLQQPITFPEDKSADIIITLAATENSGHLDLMAELAELLIDDDKISNLRNTNTTGEFKKILFSE